MCTYSADISVLHLPLPVFKSCIFIRRHERDLARNHSPDLFFIDRLFLSHFPDTTTSLTIFIRGEIKRIFYSMHDRALCTFIHLWTRNFLLNLIFNLICSVVSFRNILLFSFLFFYSISVVKIIGKRIIIEKCKELSEIGLNRQNTQQCSMFFPTLSVRAIYFRGTRDRCLKTSRILWSWRWII